jgi:UDP-glucose 6-dehydrogenase
MSETNNKKTLDRFLQKLEEVAKASHAKLLSREILSDIGAIKDLHRGLQTNKISYDNELLNLSAQYKKDFRQLLNGVMHDVWIKERLRQ